MGVQRVGKTLLNVMDFESKSLITKFSAGICFLYVTFNSLFFPLPTRMV